MIAVSGVTAITPNPGRNSWAGWRRWFLVKAVHPTRASHHPSSHLPIQSRSSSSTVVLSLPLARRVPGQPSCFNFSVELSLPWAAPLLSRRRSPSVPVA